MAGYPENWEEIAAQVKEEAGHRCEHCDHPNEFETGYVLTVHHIDANKENCAWENLAALCQRCHLRFQNKDLVHQLWLFEVPAWLQKRGLPKNNEGGP